MQEAGVPVTFAYISDAHDNHTLARAPRARRGRLQAAAGRLRRRLRDVLQAPRSTTASTRATRSSSSPSTRAITSPAAPARRSPTARCAYTHTPCAQADLAELPGQPDRRGQRQDRRAAARRRARLRHPLRRCPDLLRQRAAGSQRSGRAQARARSGGGQGHRPVRRRRGRADRRAARRHRRGADAAHGQQRSEADADVHDVRQRRLLLPDRRRPRAAAMSASTPASRGTTATARRRSATPGSAWSVPASRSAAWTRSTWTDHVDVRPTMLALLGLADNYEDDGRVVTQIVGEQGTARRVAALTAARSTRLGDVYKQLNAPFGAFGVDTLARLDQGDRGRRRDLRVDRDQDRRPDLCARRPRGADPDGPRRSGLPRPEAVRRSRPSSGSSRQAACSTRPTRSAPHRACINRGQARSVRA